ncbi:MAG: PQQ-dependent sugar dehydrogenase [Gemmatimonadota bacterium]
MKRAMTRLLIMLSLGAFAALSCSSSTDPDDDQGDNGNNGAVDLAVEIVASGFSNPIYLTAPAVDPRLFVVEQSGRIKIVESGQVRAAPFLDITDRVSSGGERGLFSVAFHPQYGSNGFFYVNYTDSNGDSRIERYSVTGDPDIADPNSAKLIISLQQPFSNHNGGLVVFGSDGMLYIGLGDGGSGGDPQGHGQNTSTLLGSLLRIDVDGGDPYAVPLDNPFIGGGGAGEIWAYGLRNPWRFSFDRVANQLYIADVGQNAWEEVDVVSASEAGLNYGWNSMEGSQCFATDPCDATDLVLPALEYGRSEGCSVTGGYVYRGSAIPGIQGHYFYSDYCSGFLRSFRFTAGSVSDEREWDVGDLGSVLSFGQDADGELYVLSGNGNLYRLVESS